MPPGFEAPREGRGRDSFFSRSSSEVPLSAISGATLVSSSSNGSAKGKEPEAVVVTKGKWLETEAAVEERELEAEEVAAEEQGLEAEAEAEEQRLGGESAAEEQGLGIKVTTEISVTTEEQAPGAENLDDHISAQEGFALPSGQQHGFPSPPKPLSPINPGSSSSRKRSDRPSPRTQMINTTKAFKELDYEYGAFNNENGIGPPAVSMPSDPRSSDPSTVTSTAPSTTPTSNQTEDFARRPEDLRKDDPLWKEVYRIQGKLYLGKPLWDHGDEGLFLRGTKPISSIADFQAQYPDVLFIILQDYPHTSPESYAVTDKDAMNNSEPPPPVSRSIQLWSRAALAMTELSARYSDFKTSFPGFDFAAEISQPYLPLFFMYSTWHRKAERLKESSIRCVKAVHNFIEHDMGSE